MLVFGVSESASTTTDSVTAQESVTVRYTSSVTIAEGVK